MKGKIILRSLLAAYILTGIFLLILALLLFYFNLGEGPVSIGIIAGYVASCFFGGFISGKKIRRQKLLWGITTGAAYFILLCTVSFLVEGKWDMTIQHALTTLLLCLGGAALGGMLA